MKFAIVAFLVIVAAYAAAQTKEGCKRDDVDARTACQTSEHGEYVKCLRERRAKRSACGGSCDGGNCGNQCDDCDCNECSSSRADCSDTCSSCCGHARSCTNNHCCYRTCKTQCRHHHHTNYCRSSCERDCKEKVIVANETQTGGAGVNNSLVHTVNTVINLQNYIDNKNFIDIPVNVNTTNINNITVEAPEGGGSGTKVIAVTGPSGKLDKGCCQIVSPRQCAPTTQFPFMKCFHYRKTICSGICRAPIMHAQSHQMCDERAGARPYCHQQTIYVPQPQPRCVVKTSWPYVSCGIERTDCQGCYSHYSSSTVMKQPPSNCHAGCYDDGFGGGPYYRQGPFYRPGFSPVPSCLQLGTCNGFDYGYGGGGFSNQIPVNGLGYPPGTYENLFYLTGYENAAPTGAEGDPSKLLLESGNVAEELTAPDNNVNSLGAYKDPQLVRIETIEHAAKPSDATVTIENGGADDNGDGDAGENGENGGFDADEEVPEDVDNGY